jgi:hypothetical protein
MLYHTPHAESHFVRNDHEVTSKAIDKVGVLRAAAGLSDAPPVRSPARVTT